jgi:hypothetical protein
MTQTAPPATPATEPLTSGTLAAPAWSRTPIYDRLVAEWNTPAAPPPPKKPRAKKPAARSRPKPAAKKPPTRRAPAKKPPGSETGG